MKFFRSIRFRLALWSALITGSVVLIFFGVSVSLLYKEYMDSIDDQMERFAEDLVEELEDQDRFDRTELVDLFDLFDDRKSLHLIAVVSPVGETLFLSSHWRDHVLELDKDRSSYHRNLVHDGDKWRYSRIKENRWQVFIGTELEDVFEVQDRILGTFLVVFPLALLMAATGGLLLAHRAMKPVASITKTAKKISDGGLGARIPVKGLENDELGQLTQVLNSMLERLESSFEQSARFSADASHELNTPLTIMQGELERAIQREEISTEDEGLLTNLLEETQRLKTITKSLLLFSRSDAGTLQLERRTFDLSAAILDLIEDVQSFDVVQGMAFTVKVEEGLRVKGDKTLLQQAFHNVLKNAVYYNRPNGCVGVSLKKGPGRIVCRITNTGPGISPENQKKVFNRFFREDSSRNRTHYGFGLGLPLAREILCGHGGDILLEKSDAKETVFLLILPFSGP